MNRARQRMSSALVACALALVLVASAGAAPPGRGRTVAAQVPEAPPNIVMVMADDLDLLLGTMGYTPNIQRLVADAGATLGSYYISDSLCCPSRTTYLRGQFAHNHGVYTNGGTTGGYERMVPLGLEDSTVATWLQEAGYRTALVGKYVNGYPLEGAETAIPAGWSEWFSPAAGNPYASYGYTMNENGTLVAYGRRPEDHITDVIADKADDFIARAAADEAPFFALVMPYAPHGPADPAPRHAALFPGLEAPRGGSYDEADVSDKPPAIALRPPLTARQMTAGDELYRKRVQSMQAVDELVARLVATLEASGELDNTYVVFTSDNGFHIGQHRLAQGKTTAYEEDVRVPFAIRGPGIPAGITVDGALIGNVDVAPTLAELAGAAVPDFVDGRSFAPLLAGTAPEPGTWRQGFLIEQYPFENERGAVITPLARDAAASRAADRSRGSAARAGLFEPPDGDGQLFTAPHHGTRSGGAAGPRQPLLGGARGSRTLGTHQTTPTAAYIALRTAAHTYVEHASGARELYDNAADPFQLDNIVSTADVPLLFYLSAAVQALHACAGEVCRWLEDDLTRALLGPIDTVAPPATLTATPATPPPTAPATSGTPSADRLWLPFGQAGGTGPGGL